LSVNLYQTTRRGTPAHSHHRTCRREKPKRRRKTDELNDKHLNGLEVVYPISDLSRPYKFRSSKGKCQKASLNQATVTSSKFISLLDTPSRLIMQQYKSTNQRETSNPHSQLKSIS
jgi:hypothetical protein